MEYPIKKYDNLNRLIYVDWNGVERCINMYWDDTTNIKIKYRLWNKEAQVEAFDKNGNVIISNITGSIIIKLPKLKVNELGFYYCVEKKKIQEWMKKLDCNKIK